MSSGEGESDGGWTSVGATSFDLSGMADASWVGERSVKDSFEPTVDSRSLLNILVEEQLEGLSGSQGSQNPAVTLFHRRSALTAELFPHRVEAEKKPRASKLPRTRLIPEQEEVITSTSLRKTFLGAIIAGLIGNKTGRKLGSLVVFAIAAIIRASDYSYGSCRLTIVLVLDVWP